MPGRYFLFIFDVFAALNFLKFRTPIPGNEVNERIPNLPSDLSLVAMQMDAFADVSDYFTKDLIPDALHLLIVEDPKTNSGGSGRYRRSQFRSVINLAFRRLQFRFLLLQILFPRVGRRSTQPTTDHIMLITTRVPQLG